MSQVVIDANSSDWPYVQVASRIRELVRAGSLGPKLPTRQELANQMEVAPMTVQRAIDLLKEEGLIYSVPGRGIYVSKK